MLRRLIESTTALCLALLLTAEAVGQEARQPQVSAQTPVAQSSTNLPRDTEVELILMETVSSATATKGQAVRLAVAKDIFVQGRILIPRGTLASGVVSRVRKGVPGERDGNVEVRPVALTLADGTKLKLKEYPTGEDACGDMGPCWAFGLFAVVISPLVVAVLPVVAVVALFQRDRDKGRATYQKMKPVGKDMTFAVCSSPGPASYVAHRQTLPPVFSTGLAPNARLSQCPNLPIPK
jgi:hypothetical protein